MMADLARHTIASCGGPGPLSKQALRGPGGTDAHQYVSGARMLAGRLATQVKTHRLGRGQARQQSEGLYVSSRQMHNQPVSAVKPPPEASRIMARPWKKLAGAARGYPCVLLNAPEC